MKWKMFWYRNVPTIMNKDLKPGLVCEKKERKKKSPR